jgi:hypothetical protein
LSERSAAAVASDASIKLLTRFLPGVGRDAKHIVEEIATRTE